MNFSTYVKEELCRIKVEDEALKVSELAGIVRMDGTILIGAQKSVSLELISENASVAKLSYLWIKELFKVECTITIQRRQKLKKNNRYIVSIPNQRQMRSILYALGMMNDDGMFFNTGIPEELIDRDDKRRAYLRGVFLGGGSISDPLKSYHLEIVANSENYAELIQNLIAIYGIEAKVSYRKENIIVYLKESNQISDFLALVGAHEAMMELENIRINKTMRNAVNRRVNCETANLNKSVNAAQRHIQIIREIENKVSIDALPETLRSIALLRINHPEASLKELGELMTPPIGKSGVNHRMRRIEEFAEMIKKEKVK